MNFSSKSIPYSESEIVECSNAGPVHSAQSSSVVLLWIWYASCVLSCSKIFFAKLDKVCTLIRRIRQNL